MKTKSLILLLLFVTIIAYSQAPQAFKYQTVIRDNTGAGIANQEVSIRVSVIPNAAGNTPIYTETHSVTTNSAGMVSLEVGNGTAVTGDFTTIDWSTGIYFLGIEVDPDGGSTYQSLGTSQLLSVPYALFAETVGNVDDADADPENELITAASLNGTTLEITEAGDLHQVDLSSLQDTCSDDQTLTEVLVSGNDAGGQRITNLGTPVDSADAATKAYVDILKMYILQLAPLTNLIDAGVPASDLLAAGYTVPELVAAGISIQDMMALGITLSEIIQNGASIDDILAEGINVDDSTGVLLDLRDSISYNWIGIGDQIWMSENLNYVSDTGHEYSYLNNPAYADTFGRLYPWHTALAMCPSGWSLPTDVQWGTMEMELGMSVGVVYNTGFRGTNQGTQLKVGGSSGFEGLLSGIRLTNGTYANIRTYGYYWTANESGVPEAYLRYLFSGAATVGRNDEPKTYSLAIRCIKD
jgi:uncharacterized protein (TIGR02145 family)